MKYFKYIPKTIVPNKPVGYSGFVFWRVVVRTNVSSGDWNACFYKNLHTIEFWLYELIRLNQLLVRVRLTELLLIESNYLDVNSYYMNERT